jgi:hypothetical protein
MAIVDFSAFGLEMTYLSLFSTHVHEIQYIVARDKNHPKYRVRENNGKREPKPDLPEMSQNRHVFEPGCLRAGHSAPV